MKKLLFPIFLLLLSCNDDLKLQAYSNRIDQLTKELEDCKQNSNYTQLNDNEKAVKTEQVKTQKVSKSDKIDNAFINLKFETDNSKNISYYRSKKLKHYINSNKISAYIIRDQYDNLTLRFKVSYYSKNSRWIFFDKFALFYDGQLFEKSFNPTLRETGVDEFEVWEYIDIVANEEMDMHLEGVSNSKDASIILEGMKSDDRKITSLEKKALNDVISAYYKATLF